MGAPDAKRPRVDVAASLEESAARRAKPHERMLRELGDWNAGSAGALSPAWLVKSTTRLPRGHPTPGAAQGCRLALRSASEGVLGVYAASGARVYLHTLPWPRDSAPQQGKEGILVPCPVEVRQRRRRAAATSGLSRRPPQGGVTRPLSHLPFRGEVQSLDCAALGPAEAPSRQLLAAADSYGCCVLATDAAPLGEGEPACGPLTLLQPPWPADEPGWAGCSLAPGAPQLLAVARGPSRCVDLYDGDLHVTTLHVPNAPLALAMLPAATGVPPGQLLALAEHGCCVSVWDARSCGGAVLRLSAGSGAASASAVLALACCVAPGGAPLLAAAGEERSLTIFDLRAAGRALRRHGGLARRELTHLRFSEADPRWIYLASADNEVLCRRWDEAGGGEAAGGARWVFRGEARWAGLALAGEGGGETLAAWTSSGSLCAAHVRGGLI